jgi:hypothetical protein
MPRRESTQRRTSEGRGDDRPVVDQTVVVVAVEQPERFERVRRMMLGDRVRRVWDRFDRLPPWERKEWLRSSKLQRSLRRARGASD